MKAKSKSNRRGTEQNRQRKSIDAHLARRAHITVTEVRTIRVLFPAFYERIKRAA